MTSRQTVETTTNHIHRDNQLKKQRCQEGRCSASCTTWSSVFRVDSVSNTYRRFSAHAMVGKGSDLSSPISVVPHSDPGLCQKADKSSIPIKNNGLRPRLGTLQWAARIQYKLSAVGPDNNWMIPRHAWPRFVCLTISSHRYWLREGFSENFRLVM